MRSTAAIRPTARSTSIPAPVGGLNDRDSIADMPPTDAVVLENWWTYPSYVGVRKGRTPHVTGFANAVETLVEYLPVSGISKLFAASGTSIYDVTASGAVGSPVQTGLANARFRDVSITTPGGSFLYLVNGSDSPRLWDGATWTSVTGVSVPAITGVAPSKFTHAALFKNRLYFVETESMHVWYLPVNSIGGAASLLDMGSIFRLGGSVMAIYTWTIDAGAGSDDHLAIISTNGEVAVYSGTDPSSVDTWSLVGVFVLGRPIGRRCGVKYGGDLAVMTTEGVYPLGKGLLSASVDRRIALTDKIQNATGQAANSLRTTYGWQLTLYADANMLLMNVPSGNGANYQYAMNTITGAWTKFTGWNATCWLNASSGLYYGDTNSIQRAWRGDIDNTTPIQADLGQAFSYFGSKAQNKYFTMVRPYLMSTGQPSILYGLNLNYELSPSLGALAFTPPTGMVWGSMSWGTMVWGGALNNLTGWASVGGVGNSAGLRLKVQNNGAELRLTNTDFVYNVGGIL